jgi:hypothetical protein
MDDCALIDKLRDASSKRATAESGLPYRAALQEEAEVREALLRRIEALRGIEEVATEIVIPTPFPAEIFAPGLVDRLRVEVSRLHDIEEEAQQ